MEKERRTKALVITVLLIVVAGLTIAFAALSTTLNINGTAYLDAAKWGIKFENLSEPVSVGTATTTGTAKIEESKSAEITGINVSLSTPGDKVTYTVDLVNKGTINAKIDKIEKTELTSEQKKYLTFKVTDKDGKEVSEGDILSAGEIRNLTITIEFIKDLTKEDLPTSTSTISLSYKLNFVQTDEKVTSTGQSSSSVSEPVSFSTDSWETIVNAVKNNNTDAYNIGDEKEIDMGDLGTHTVRVANKTVPDECHNEVFSQTACGFVIEFSDIIVKHNMNSELSNVGGWPASSMAKYVNSTIYDALPENLKNNILDTMVVSGYGANDVDNFISNNKLYLPSAMEIWDKVNDTYGFYDGVMHQFDTAENNTRQLDYYKKIGVNASNYATAVKKYNDEASPFWLRTPEGTGNAYFIAVGSDGSFDVRGAVGNYGVSPAFRIGK